MHRKNEGRDIRYTPPQIVDAIRKALGTPRISLDPCGNPNRGIAVRTISERENGLTTPWRMKNGDLPRSVYVNPPGTLILPFAERFVDLMNARSLPAPRGAFLIFSHDHSTKYWELLTTLPDVAIVMLDRRYRFPDDEGKMFDVGRSHSIIFHNVFDRSLLREVFEATGLGSVWFQR